MFARPGTLTPHANTWPANLTQPSHEPDISLRIAH